MKNVYLIVGFFILLASACKEYDDIAQWNMANNQEQRLTALEELCSQMNTNIIALHDLIGASINGDYILNVSPILKEGVEIGYTITFAKSGTITIYHGKDGQKGEQGDAGEGIIPSIGIRQDLDGVYYWTLNNEWLLDESGKKVKASGTDGQNGSSAYELAQEKGYTGTLEEWLTTLKGETGNSGKSAYEIAVDKGYSGTESEWLETLNGNNGQTPKLKIENGRWLLSMDNGNTWEDIGKATGDKGQDGTGGDSMFKKIDYTTSNEYVIFTLADNTELKLPKYGQGGGSRGELSITFSETTDILVKPLVNYEITYTITGANISTSIAAIGFNKFVATVKPNSQNTGTIIITPPIIIETFPINKVVVFISNGENVTIMKTLTFQYEDNSPYITIPDINFKTYLVENFDDNGDGEISYLEALQVTSINCTEKNIQTLEGLQYFSNITQLYCYKNKLTSLDVAKLYKLQHLNCENNQLTTLDLTKNIALETLSCSHNNLTTLDVTRCTKLKSLSCSFNNLITLDVGYHKVLTRLSCNNNELTSLDVNGCSALTGLICNQNQLTSLDVNGCTAMTELWCHNNQLPSLDVSGCTALTIRLLCSYNKLSSAALDKIFTDLPQGKTWHEIITQQSTISIDKNPGRETCNTSIVTDKGWKVSY